MRRHWIRPRPVAGVLMRGGDNTTFPRECYFDCAKSEIVRLIASRLFGVSAADALAIPKGGVPCRAAHPGGDRLRTEKFGSTGCEAFSTVSASYPTRTLPQADGSRLGCSEAFRCARMWSETRFGTMYAAAMKRGRHGFCAGRFPSGLGVPGVICRARPGPYRGPPFALGACETPPSRPQKNGASRSIERLLGWLRSAVPST